MVPIDFTSRADELAGQVLGTILWHGQVAVRLTEVEAYLGADDPASHAYRGPRGRAVTMFAEPGRLYVYLSYGIHLAANLVCSPPGQASALLLRAGEVVAGHELARERRGWSSTSEHKLASGPGNLGRVLGLSLADDGAQLGAEFRIEVPRESPPRICRGPRVGISVAADRPLRFWIEADPTVSAYRRSPRAAAPATDSGSPIVRFGPADGG